jgi:hypothetical protein
MPKKRLKISWSDGGRRLTLSCKERVESQVLALFAGVAAVVVSIAAEAAAVATAGA